MSYFVEVAPSDFTTAPFERIGNQWMLIAAEMNGRVNAMTASWGGLGVMWHRNVAFIVIRPHRFTRELVDGSSSFSLNFFASSHKEMLAYFGSVSGRDEDKIGKYNLKVERDAGAPYFAESDSVLLCRKLYAHPYAAEFFIDRDIDGDCYPEKDYHIMYIGEVKRILARKQAGK